MIEPEKPLKKKEKMALDAELALKIHAEEQAELDRMQKERAAQEEASRAAINEELDSIQAMIEADELLAARLQAEEQEKYSIEEKSRMLVEMIAERYKYNQLKGRSYEEIQKLFDSTYKQVNLFVSMDSEDKVKGSRKKSIGIKRAGGKSEDKSAKKAEIEHESSSKRAGDEIESYKSKKQKIDEHVEAEKDDDQEEAEIKKHMEIVIDDEVAIDVIPLATKPPMIVEYKIDKEGKMGYFKLIRADRSSKRYSLMIKMLQDINREDLETLWKFG
ncbi:hypothetical protein Tco_0734567 [Tanacetum coccineum]